MMEGAHGHARLPLPAALASAWDALRRVSAANPWLRLVRPSAVQATAPFGLVLFDSLPGLLDALGAGALGHG